MAKAKDIKLNQSVPVTPINQQTNSTTTGTQNTIPTTTTTTPTNTQSSTFQKSDPLWKQWLRSMADVTASWDDTIKQTKAGLKEEWNRGVRDKDMLNAYKPENTFEQTAWGWNYWMDRAVSQANNEQWQYNALNWTWHVVWIPERNNQLLYQPATQQQWQRFPVRPATLGGTAEVQQSEPEQTYVAPQSTAWTTTRTSWATTWTQTQWRQLKNADVNFSQYWDDSSAPNQATRWWQNDKYTWEFVKNSNLWYDPNITTADLDPNYLYWMDAQWANSENAGYIARRNDMIASALYNEAIAQWRNPTKDDVINFLSKQKNWNNSTEADRYNTIESVWKRLGGIESENPINTPAQPEANNEPTYSDESLNNMQQDLNKSTAWDLYGKVTADQSTHIKTLEDDNSVYRSMNESRIQSFKQLRWMDSQSIAAAIVSNAMASDSQAMRDLMQYDPAKYQEVQQQIKQLKWQMTINSITNGDTYPTFNNGNAVTNDISDFAATYSNWTTSSADILKNVNSSLSSNDAASTASETMASIESDMAVLQNRMKNLKKEASTVFKWDVPQYIVNAYVANRTAEIQDQLSILENRYNAAQSRYQQEWEQTKWKAEFDLKKQELELKKQNAKLDEWSTRQGIALKWADLNGTTNGTTPLSTLQAQEALNVLSNFSSDYPTNSHWWQCGRFVKKYLASIGVNLPNMSSIDSKKSLIDDSITDPSDWDIVIMSSKNYPQNWHMAIVESVDDDGTIHLLESNWNWDEQVHRRTVKPWDKSILWYYRPTGWTTATSWDASLNNLEWHGNVYNTSLYPWWDSLTDDEKITVWNLLTYQTDPATLPKTWENWESNKKIRAAAGAIGRQFWYDERKFKQVDAVQKAWDKAAWPSWVSSANSTAASILKSVADSFSDFNKYDIQTVNSWINQFKNEIWDPTVWAMYTDLRVASSEIAKALKGNASATQEEIREINNLLSWKMSNAQAQQVFRHFARNLVEKNASEAKNYARVVWYKPDSIYLDDVSEWMASDLWIDVSEYYNYTPNGWWAAAAKSNSWGGTNSTYSPQMTQNLFNY